jgi:myosin-5
MLIPSSSRTSEIRDTANKILTRVLGASSSESLDKYHLGLTEIFFRADMLASLENLRTTRLNHCAIMIQKNLKAKYYRHKYLEARNAILLFQSVIRRHLAWKHMRETRKIEAATTIQRAWRLRRHMKSWRQYRRKVVIVQSLWRGKCARCRCEKIREAEALSDAVG